MTAQKTFSKKLHFRQFGFTMIELLIVISIIGLLAAISTFALQGARESARDARRQADLEEVRSALELYKADCNHYPTASEVVFGGGNDLTGDGGDCSASNVYLEDIPQDTSSGRNYVYVPAGAPPDSYVLCAALEEGSGSVVCGTGCGETCNYQVKNP